MLIGIQLQHENGNGEIKFTKCSSFCMNYSKTRTDLKMNSNVRRMCVWGGGGKGGEEGND